MKKIGLFILLPFIGFAQSTLITPGSQSLNNDTTVSNQFDIYGNGLVIHEKTGVTTQSPQHINFSNNQFIFDAKEGRISYGKIQEGHYNELGDYAIAGGYNSGAKGQAAVGIGWQVRANGLSATAIGSNTVADTAYATAFGRGSQAKGYISTAMGYNARASNSYSTAFGNDTEASGLNSIAGGKGSVASGNGSVALGYGAESTGSGSAAFGLGHAFSSYATAAGIGSFAEDTAAVAMGFSNHANGYASVSMGNGNHADGRFSVAMGNSNSAVGVAATAFGASNNVEGDYSLVSGKTNFVGGNYSFSSGKDNHADGLNSTAIGHQVYASADYSTALGSKVRTNNSNYTIFHEGAFMIGDSPNGSKITYANSENRFFSRFRNGYQLYTDANNNFGAQLLADQTAWSVISDSTRKENFIPSNGEQVLESVSEMRIGTWNYKGQDASIYRHWGVMAQDFYHHFGKDAFGTVGNDTSINTADFDGVGFAAIKALEERTRLLKGELDEERGLTAAFTQTIGQLQSQMASLAVDRASDYLKLKDEVKELKNLLLRAVSLVE